jgi:hypothetical protein
LNDHDKDHRLEFCPPFAYFTEANPSFGLHIRSVFTGMELLTNRTAEYGEQKTHPPRKMLHFIQQSVQFDMLCHFVGTVFLEEIANSECYGTLLQGNTIPFFQGVSCDPNEVFIQVCGVRSHTATAVLEIFDTHFRDPVISNS